MEWNGMEWSVGGNPQYTDQVLLKSVRLHALQTNYETRWAIAVHCYLICRRCRCR